MSTTQIARPAAPVSVRPSHLYQLDLFRVITFAFVIFMHVLGATTFPQDVPADAIEGLLHFTRQAFFALSTFVLVFQYRDRPLAAGRFWRRRVPLVAVPYVLWSVIYWAYSMVTADQPPASAGAALRALVIEIGTGTAWYHLYFLLVTLQVYLLFPLLMKLVGVIRRHPWTVLAVSGAVQVAVIAFLSDPPAGVDYTTTTRFYTTLLPYQFYSVLGAVAGVHLKTVHDWLLRHRWLVLGGLVVSLGVAEAGYFSNVREGLWPELASDAFRLYLIPWFVAAIATIYLAGARWSEGRRRGSRFVSWAVDRSFAIFLAHPIALALLGPLIALVGDGPGAPWTTIVVYPATVALTFVIVEILRRLPVSRMLTGRPPLRPAARVV
ncbi:acyltransferase [Amycolatopsis sp. PS_44_ISF1]|uniref:acyltransferase n=1 Tax=Amycolatopsis sp. PS_44_ISF1 TaxID=2974917 RepID=UPI0028DFB27E|nr:acyltransferase [Amycolatopsis sp. PS_44_ISF1]MDT8915352.1 acyltransferase [Amycolatopsis sp. PS_44_ISF1]